MKSAGELVEECAISFGHNFRELPLDWNVAPTKDIYIIKENPSGKKELAVASWGIIAPWSLDRTNAIRSQSMAINARSESVEIKPTFKSAFRYSRCLIPVTGYYEWATEMGAFKPKQPFFVTNEIPNKSLLFTGIYSSWVDPNSGEIIESAALLTRQSVGFLATVHSRMPVFLPQTHWAKWLNPELNSVADLKELIEVTQPDAGLKALPVSDLVNSTKNNGPRLITPIDISQPETLF